MSSKTEKIPELHFSVLTLIKSFFGTLTADQWLLLIQGAPDQPTKDLLLDLLDAIIRNLSAALQIFVTNTDVEVTKELINTGLSNGVIDGFKYALDVKSSCQCPSAEALRDMLSKEVLSTVLRSISNSPDEHVPPEKRLEKMLNLTCNMIHVVKEKVRAPADVMSEEPTTSAQLYPAARKQVPLKSKARAQYWYDQSSSDDQYSSDSTSPSSIHVKPFNNKKTLAVKSATVGEKTPEVKKETVEKMRCWFNTNLSEDSGSEGSVRSIVPSVAVEETAPAYLSLEEKRKNTVVIVVEQLVSLIYSKSKVSNHEMDPENVIENLMTKTWAAVEGVDFDPSSKTAAGLDKLIFKDLVKKCGIAEMMLLNMRVSSRAFEKFVIDAVKARLAPPPKERSCVCRFFSSGGRAIAGFCKRSEAVD